MELAALGSVSVLRDADVVTSREKARQARLRRLLVVLVVIGVPVIGRTAAGVVRYLQGNYMRRPPPTSTGPTRASRRRFCRTCRACS